MIVRNCLRIWGNATVEGNLSVLGNASIGGTLTIQGVPFNNLIGLAGAIGPAGAAGATGPAGSAGIPGIGGILGYAAACNSSDQLIPDGGGAVTFDTPMSAAANITPPAINGSTFTVTAAGIYRIQYQVRGTPETLTPPSPLQFEVRSNGTAITCGTYAADVQTTSLPAASAGGTEVVNGYTLVSLPAGAVITLNNITLSSTDTVELTGIVVSGTAAVNASMIIERIA